MNAYYINISWNGIEFPLFKFKSSHKQTIITIPLSNQLELNKLHDTYHEPDPTKGHPYPIVHTRRDSSFGDSLQNNVVLHNRLLRTASQQLIHSSFIDISETDWSKIKPFTKTKFSNKAVLDAQMFNCYLSTFVYVSDDSGVDKTLNTALERGEIYAIRPHSDGFTLFSPQGKYYAAGNFTIPNTNKLLFWVVVNTTEEDMPDKNLPSNNKRIKYIALAQNKEKIGET